MYSINHQLLIEAPLQAVYQALVNAAGLSKWWTPNTELLNDTLRFHFGGGYYKDMLITEQQENASVRWQCKAGDPEWIGTRLSFELKHGDHQEIADSNPEIHGQVEQAATDRGTVLLFRHTGWRENTLTLAECSYTWAMFLKSLKLYCETGTGKAWPGQHR